MAFCLLLTSSYVHHGQKRSDDMKKIKNTLLYIDGNKIAFRCHCGSNVFHPVSKKQKIMYGHLETDKVYECNGCKDWYWQKEDD